MRRAAGSSKGQWGWLRNAANFISGVANYRQHIYAGAEPVAVYNRTASGVNTMSYILEDHQGSVSAITSSSGAVNVAESFSTFGNRRNSGTWSGAPTTTDLAFSNYTRRWYTFQTAPGQAMGLNHMNGRVQDAILGRFLSPDPIIQNREDAQDHNRYSYVGNNPVTFSDLSQQEGKSIGRRFLGRALLTCVGRSGRFPVLR